MAFPNPSDLTPSLLVAILLRSQLLILVQAQKEHIGLERAGIPTEVARVAGFLASGFSSYMTGSNMVVDGGASVMCPLTVPI